MNAIAAMAPSTPIFATIIAPDREACAAPVRNNTALRSIHTTMDGGLMRRRTWSNRLLTVFLAMMPVRQAFKTSRSETGLSPLPRRVMDGLLEAEAQSPV